jgi:sec-independent protein translocase protein TatA
MGDERMSIGIWQIALILVIVMILFGAGKLPRVMGDIAKGVKSFKSGLKDDENEAVAEAQPEAKEVEHAATEPAPATQTEVPTDEPAKT